MTIFLLVVVVALLIDISWDLHCIKDSLEKNLNRSELTADDVSEAVQDALYEHFIEQRYKFRTDYPPLGQHGRQDK